MKEKNDKPDYFKDRKSPYRENGIGNVSKFIGTAMGGRKRKKNDEED